MQLWWRASPVSAWLLQWQHTSSTLGAIPRKCSAAAFNHLAVKLPPLPPFLTAGVKQGLPVLVYSKRNQFHYLYCTHHRALCCMKWSQLYLYQYKNKVITNQGGDIQSNFSLLRDAVCSATETFIGQSHSLRKKIHPTVSQESHQYLHALVFLSCMKEMHLFS